MFDAEYDDLRVSKSTIGGLQRIGDDSPITVGSDDYDDAVILLCHHFSDALESQYEYHSRGEITEAVDDARSGRETGVSCSDATLTWSGDCAEALGLSGARREDAIALLVDHHADDLIDLYCQEDADPDGDAKELRKVYADAKAYRRAMRENPPAPYLSEDAIRDEPSPDDADLSVSVNKSDVVDYAARQSPDEDDDADPLGEDWVILSDGDGQVAADKESLLVTECDHPRWDYTALFDEINTPHSTERGWDPAEVDEAYPDREHGFHFDNMDGGNVEEHLVDGFSIEVTN